jgi:hypothetical protein
MANRNYNRAQALEKEVKSLYAEISIGAAGAPTLVRGLGIASVARDSAGVYTVTLQDAYNRLMSFGASQEAASAEDLKFQLAASDVSSAKTVQFRCIAAAVETDPSNGSKLRLQIDVKNSSI